MEEKINIINDLSIEEREEVFVDIARMLEGTAREAFVEGNRHFAALSPTWPRRFVSTQMSWHATMRKMQNACLSSSRAIYPYPL